MNNLFASTIKNRKSQYIISILLIILVACISYLVRDIFGYRVVALFLLLAVSILAMLFDILPVLIASILSALIWNFFFIPPKFTFHISTTEDLLMFLMYFIIALVNAVLTFKIREQEKKARDKEEKENTIKLYNTLFNTLSHELRTPISTIIAAVDTLKENQESLSTINQTMLYNEIDIASLRLNRQVENLLNMSRLESGMLKPKFEWIEINELVFTVIQKLADNAVNHQIVFEPAENLPLIKLDGMMLEQILLNILHNAIQYTPPKSTIIITASLQNDLLNITFKDDGNGFPEKEIEKAFNKFYRLPNTKAGGTGLGLSIVKGFVSALHGKIKLENNNPKGAKFTIELPCEISYINSLKNE